MQQNILATISNVPVKHIANTKRIHGGESVNLFDQSDLADSFSTISRWPGYLPTPLFSLSALARHVGVAEILYKNEGERFGLGSFKALGGAYAVHRLRTETAGATNNVTVASATDGNHGRSVAWGAKTLGYRCVIYIHANVSVERERALLALGADVVRIDGNYDESVRLCSKAAGENGWLLVPDTVTNGDCRQVPKTVMAGYTVLASEIVSHLSDRIPTHLFVQSGVGGLAATLCEVFRHAWGVDAPRLIIVEPELAACLYASAAADAQTAVEIGDETVMAGLSCGEVSTIAWEVLGRHADHFLTIPDSVVATTMRLLADAPFGDVPIVAGESAVAGLAALIATRRQSKLAHALSLDERSRVLVIGTEGATDPRAYELLTGRTAESVETDRAAR